jgi:Xaa-Pro dipeptidase
MAAGGSAGGDAHPSASGSGTVPPATRGYPRFSVGEMQRRWAALHQLMAERDVRAVVVRGTGRYDRAVLHLTDWPGGTEEYLLFPSDPAYGGEPVELVQLFNHVPMAKRVSLLHDVRWGGPRSFETLAAVLRERGLTTGRLGLIGTIPYQAHLHWREALPGVEWVDLSGAFALSLTVKSAEEIERIRIACELTDRAMEAMERTIRPGLRESELPAAIEAASLEGGGYAGIHFFAAMPMDRPDIFVPAQYPSDRVMARGDALICEISGAYWGYSGQVHRTYFIGEPPRPAWRSMHDAAVETFLAVEAVLRDGATVADVLDAAAGIHAGGYDVCDDMLHGLNQLPPIVRTRPTSRADEAFRFRENMVVVIQPNPTLADPPMGLQFGETLLITRTGTQRLHRYRREPIVCGG